MRSTRLYTTTKLYKEMMGFVFGVVLVLPPLLFAQSVTLPFTLRNGDVADANQVNANFTALQNAVINNANRSDNKSNTAGGVGALQSNTFGDNNTAFGAGALQRTASGNGNTAVGAEALSTNTIGSFNTAVGSGALRSNTDGGTNTAVGVAALGSNTTGRSNAAYGNDALVLNTSGEGNIAIGTTALLKNTTGSSNTAVGIGALAQTNGNNNIAVGINAGRNLTSGDNNIYLDNLGVNFESNTMRLGETQTSTFIAGITGVPVSGNAVLISSTGQLGIQASSIRYKRDIQPMGAHSRGLLQLRPVIFHYKHDAQGEQQYGLIAEEVAKVYPELVTRGANGEVESVRYHEVIPMLLNELQHQQRQLVELQAQNARLRAAVVQQQKRDERQQAQTAALAARLQRLEEAVTRAATLASR